MSRSDDKEQKEAGYSVPPVERAIKLLWHVADGGSLANTSKTAKELGINRTTLIRLIATLEAQRFIERGPNGVHRLGTGLISLATQALSSREVVVVAEPVVSRLAAELSLSAHLGVLEGREVVYLLRHAPNLSLVSNIRIGSRLPAHATTMGRIMLAHLPEAQVETLFSDEDLFPVTEHTASSREALRALLEADRAQGLAWSHSFFEPGISSAAAPIFDHTRQVVAAINVTGPDNAFDTGPNRRAAIAQALRQAAEEISSRLGYVAPSGKRHGSEQNQRRVS